MRRLRILAVAALLGMAGAPPGVTAQGLTPHFPAWDRYFEVSWEPFERRGQPHLWGYIVSKYGTAAWRVQLLVESLDASGQVVAQRVEWLPSTVPGFSRAYYEAPVPQRTPAYRVSVFAFDFIQGAFLQSP
jgi:hypothetical protein